jgi:probable phosphoglycerate mutase
MVKRLYVVTHPQATHHVEGVVGGWHDSALTDLGLRQAERIGQRLRQLVPEDAPTEITSSDLRRTRQTAEAIARALRTPIRTTPDLREISYGQAEGQPQSWLDAGFAHPPPAGNRLDHDVGIPGAETRRRFATRIYRAMDHILASPWPYQIVVTHGFALTFVVAAWVGMPLDSAGAIAVASTSGGITHLHEDGLFHNHSIVTANETSHLDRVEEDQAR